MTLDATIAALVAEPVPAEGIAVRAPSTPGLYAWWAGPAVLPAMPGPAHPDRPDLRLLYVGIAGRLRSRLTGDHLRRSGRSTLRRTLAGLLLDELRLTTTRRTDRVVLVDEDETRLTRWMVTHLLVSWCAHPAPGDVEAAVIAALAPPLNVEHATGPARDGVIAARRRFRASAAPPADVVIARASAADAPELLVLQRCCWVTEAILNDTLAIPALHETLDEVAAWVADQQVWTVRAAGRLVAAVRARAVGDRWEIGRLMVAPDQRGNGLGRRLLLHAEAAAPAGTCSFELFTGARSERNIRMYRAAGYELCPAREPIEGAVFLAKTARTA